ncbi:Xaa-Pro peptidase family protein [Azospirillum sp. B4]|uniref:M24 family metallopeptidase n=1 Tax=Azospirillum sp. B4 TaxID=95605 RepID=UPI0003477F7C|nr:Xaa-Pro peptidase family protein [Azospirillum sp. B4]
MVSRRLFLAAASALPLSAGALSARAAGPATNDLSALKPLTTGAKAITVEERRARIAKLQDLMARQGVGAFLVESGSSLDYFTGIRWHRSERTTAALIPAKGEVVVVTPAFEEPSVRETLQVGGDVRPWDEHESPFQRLVQALRDRGVANGTVAVEPTTRFFIIDGIRQVTKDYDLVSGDGLVRACRMHKSPAELALMQAANDVTLAALRYAHAHTRPGMGAADIGALVDSATAALGGRPDFSLVLLNEASAYPHGSLQPEVVKEGSTVLLDCGCSVHGYQSDISRTWVHGTPSAKQRKVWQTVKRGQEIALETAKPGIPVGDIDKAVRRYYEGEGWGPGYRLPGLSHRTGHGIGLDGHESPYLVLSDTTPLEAGMCFSDEPGLYIPGEFGIRLEDCWHMTDAGPKLFTPLAASIVQPI